MMRRKSKWEMTVVVLAGAATLLVGAVNAQAAGKTFIIDESTDFTGNGCPNSDVNNVGASLRSVLKLDGWTGFYFKNSVAWPQDFWDSSVAGGGLDHLYGDTKTLAVYAGHGNIGSLQWGFQRNGACNTNLQTQARLGTQNGNVAAYAMYLTSCTMNIVDSHPALFAQQLRQQFGYHNSPSIKDNQPGAFYLGTATWLFGGLTNRTAWLEAMEDRPGWGTGDNSPRVVTTGQNFFFTFHNHFFLRLGDGTSLIPAAEPHAFFRASTRNNGAGPC